MKTLKVINVVGARPNFIKIAPIHEEMQTYPEIEPFLLHTGQHYDHLMSDIFFHELRLPEPHRYLEVGSSGHGEQTGKIMIGFERACQEIRPDLIVVVGDVNSTIGCSLVAAKMKTKVAHVEAGLRSFDRTMPEEVNRILTDQIADYLFTTEVSAHTNLEREGISADRVFFVGNVMIDTLLRHRDEAARRPVLEELGLVPHRYVLATLHRPSNVDERQTLSGLLEALATVSEKLSVVFPTHPRVRRRITDFGLDEKVKTFPNLRLIDPLGYLDFLKCIDNSLLVITDSGGIQEETTALDVPCITVRDNTERPVTVTEGTNVVVGRNSQRLVEEAFKVVNGERKNGKRPELWDGKAAERIVRILWEKELLA